MLKLLTIFLLVFPNLIFSQITVEEINLAAISKKEHLRIYDSPNFLEVDTLESDLIIGFLYVNSYHDYVFFLHDDVMYIIDNKSWEESNSIIGELTSSVNIHAYTQKGNILWSFYQNHSIFEGLYYFDLENKNTCRRYLASGINLRQINVKDLTMNNLKDFSREALSYKFIYEPCYSYYLKDYKELFIEYLNTHTR